MPKENVGGSTELQACVVACWILPYLSHLDGELKRSGKAVIQQASKYFFIDVEFL